MTHPGERHIPWRAHLPPAILLLVAGGLIAGWLRAWAADQGAVRTAPWWVYLFLVLMSVALVALAGAVTIDPRPLALRRALAGTALAWTGDPRRGGRCGRVRRRRGPPDRDRVHRRPGRGDCRARRDRLDHRRRVARR